MKLTPEERLKVQSIVATIPASTSDILDAVNEVLEARGDELRRTRLERKAKVLLGTMSLGFVVTASHAGQDGTLIVDELDIVTVSVESEVPE